MKMINHSHLAVRLNMQGVLTPLPHKHLWFGVKPPNQSLLLKYSHLPTEKHACFLSGRSQVQISVHRLAILAEKF